MAAKTATARLSALTSLLTSLVHPVGARYDANERSSRWWFHTHSPAFVAQAVQISKAHRGSLTGVYLYAGLGIGANGTFTAPHVDSLRARTAPLLALGLTVGVALGLEQSAVEDGAALRAVPAATAAARAANLSSLIIDYEPRTDVTHAHAVAYARFVTALARALHADGNGSGHRTTLEMCVSSWSILTEFELYAKTGVDGMMSMASTYFGRSVSLNEGWVARELSDGVSLDQCRVGVGSTNAIHQKWDYQWTEAKLGTFVEWLTARGVRHLDVWRTDIDALNATNGTAPWLYQATARFLQQPELGLSRTIGAARAGSEAMIDGSAPHSYLKS